MTAASLAAIAAAEAEARHYSARVEPASPFDKYVLRVLRDRLRLCARDTATLERHSDNGAGECDVCVAWDNDASTGALAGWPCPDAQAVLDYWEQAR